MDTIHVIIEQAHDGQPTLAVVNSADGKKQYLHSTVAPKKEADAFAVQFDSIRFDTLIVLGFGLGYHLLKLVQNADSYKKILLIDALDTASFSDTYPADIQKLLLSPHVQCIRAQDISAIESIIEQHIDLSDTKGVQLAVHTASMRIFPDYYAAIKTLVQKHINKSAESIVTKKAFGIRYLKNALVHFSNLDTYTPVNTLFDTHTGSAALVVSSGPSLSRYIESLEQNRGLFVLIAADSALAPLDAYGIIPDYVVSIDPQAYVHEHLRHRALDHIAVVTSCTAYPFSAGVQKFISLNTHPIAQLLQAFSPQAVGTIDSHTGSVTGDALCLAEKMGCSAVGIIGADASFYRYETYARGTAYQNRYSSFLNSRCSTSETRNFFYIMNSSGKVKQHNVYTRKNFLQYKASIEKYIAAAQQTMFYSLQNTGLVMENTRCVCIDDFFDMCKRCSPVNNRRAAHTQAQTLHTLMRLVSQKLISDKNLVHELVYASIDARAYARRGAAFEKQLIEISKRILEQ